MSTQIYILQDVQIALAMPDGTSQSFTLQRPNSSDSFFWYKITQDVPSGGAIYKDPIRRRQRGQTFYRPEFHFSYSWHRMFLTQLLAAENIQLITGFDEWHIDCLLDNNSAVKNFLAGTAASTGRSGQVELVFTGRKRETWQEALNYFFYYLPGYMLVTCDSTEITCDSTEVWI
jgi:hypothetical protein